MSEETLNKPTLSFSSVSKFLKCPRLYYLENVKKVETFANGIMIQSGAWHQAAACNAVQKRKSGVDLPLDQMKALFMGALDEKFKVENVRLKENENRPTLESQGLAITEFFHKLVAPRIVPVLVEKYFRVSLGASFPFDLSGVWDLVDADNIIRDLKAKGQTPNQADVDRELQLTIYALAWRIIYQEPEGGLCLDVVVKNKMLKYVRVNTKRTADDCYWALGLIERAAFGIGAGCDHPGTDGWWCSPKMCDQWTRCRVGTTFHGGKK